MFDVVSMYEMRFYNFFCVAVEDQLPKNVTCHDVAGEIIILVDTAEKTLQAGGISAVVPISTPLEIINHREEAARQASETATSMVGHAVLLMPSRQ